MREFRVWAPEPKRMELDLRGSRREMSRQGEHFSAEAEAEAGDDYAFVVDGRALPDPRSPFQPEGVHGPSRVDDAPFAWTDGDWSGLTLQTAVIYELHVGTFSPEGTFDGVIGKLDHVRGLGVTAIELMPVAEFPGTRGWGYDGVDLYAAHHAYGGPEGLRRLVNECHGRGLAVVLDVVYNHLGPDGNFLPAFGPYFTDRYRTPWGDALNLDAPGSDGVRDFLLDNACRWLSEFHIDGLRLDAVHAIVDTSAVHILEELAQRVRAIEAATRCTRWLIAESDLNDPRIVRSPKSGGYGLDAQWSDDFHHALHALLTGERTGYYVDFGRVADLATALQSAYVYAGRYSRFRGRRFGRPANGINGARFVAYMQNHDQVGNRALGERSGQLLTSAQLKIAAALVLCSPFTPMLFAGEEWGAVTPFQYFTDHQEPALAGAVRGGRRKELASFDWRGVSPPDPQDPQTFERSKLDWSQPGLAPHGELLGWHAALIELRRTIPELTDGRLEQLEVQHAEAPAHLVMRRGGLTLACNFSAEDVEIQRVPGDVVLASGQEPGERGRNVVLAPVSATVWLAR